MPRAHFECPVCKELFLIEYRAVDVGGPNWPPECLNCTEDWPLVVAPQPGDYKIDLRTDGMGDGTSHKFSVTRQVPTRDGLRQVTEEVSSLAQIRKIEKESESRYANGEGEPLRFRAFSHDQSNRDRSSFGAEGSIGGRAYDSGRAPAAKKNITVRRHGTTEPDIPTHRIGGISPLTSS